MILTGKALDDFFSWLNREAFLKKDIEFRFKNLFESSKYALIIEWFDSVGVYVEIQIHQVLRGVNMWRGKINNCVYDELEYKSNRQEATKQSIIKANEIYNSNF